MSNTASATTLSAGSYSLNGVWEQSNGAQITVSGNSGVNSSFGTPNALGQDAINKGYLTLGGQRLRNITSTGSLTWSGQAMTISYYESSPNIATGTGWQIVQ